MNADACFCDAGFEEFDDPDDQWDLEWKQITELLLLHLNSFGESKLVNQADVYQNRKRSLRDWLMFWRGTPTRPVNLSPVDRLILSTHDDQFPPAVVEVGIPPKLYVWTSTGHPILWISGVETGSDPDRPLRTIAGQRPVLRYELKWECLLGNAAPYGASNNLPGTLK